MPNSIDTLARAYALELLSALNNQPHIGKEHLFADAVAYYRWLLGNKEALESLTIYWYEFKAHHKALVAGMEPDVRVGCFITWFVEQRFYTLPPLAAATIADEKQLRLFQRTRFSQPSFRLPTGDPVESYLIQWLYWHLDNLPMDNLQVEDTRISRWSCDMACEIEDHEFESGEYTRLLRNGTRFFVWCRNNLRAWDVFMELFARFLASSDGRAVDPSNIPQMDACFIAWFCQRVLDPSEQQQTKPVAPREHNT